MKKVMTAVAALALLGATTPAALAQDGPGRGEHGDHGDRGDRGHREDRGAVQAPQAAQAPQAPRGDRHEGRGRGPDGVRQAPEGGGYNPAMRRSWRNAPEVPAQAPAAREAPRPPVAQAPSGARQDRRPWRDDGDRRGWSGDDRRWNDGGRNVYDPRRAERPRYDRRNYPSVHRLDRRYQGPRYRPPNGFYVRSWSYGQILPRGWFAPQYRILDWWSYGLPIPPLGYDWVRVGDDVLLVDTFTGRVVEVIYDVFW